MWWLELDGVPPRAGRPARIALRRDVPVTTIGRLASQSVMMMDPTLPQQYISRSHATIMVRPRPLRPLLVNLSLNGTKVDTRALVRDESTDLYPGEAVVFGHRASATEYRYIVRHRDLAGLLRAVGRSIGRLLALQRRAAERVYAPSGAGYHEAASSFAGAASQQSTQQEASQPSGGVVVGARRLLRRRRRAGGRRQRPLDAAPSPPRKRERPGAAESPVSPVLSVGEPSAAAAAACEDRLDGDDAATTTAERRGVDRRRRRGGGGVAGARGGRRRVAGGAEGRAPVRRVQGAALPAARGAVRPLLLRRLHLRVGEAAGRLVPALPRAFGAEPPKCSRKSLKSPRASRRAPSSTPSAPSGSRAPRRGTRAAAERAAWTARAEAKAKADDDGAAATLHALEVGYTAEYARSGRSTCRRCLRRIGDGELRYGVRTRVPIFAHTITAWHHARCLRLRECPGLDDVADVEGFAALRPADQRRVRRSLAPVE